jgi:hypothetical protein
MTPSQTDAAAIVAREENPLLLHSCGRKDPFKATAHDTHTLASS